MQWVAWRGVTWRGHVAWRAVACLTETCVNVVRACAGCGAFGLRVRVRARHTYAVRMNAAHVCGTFVLRVCMVACVCVEHTPSPYDHTTQAISA